MKGSNVLWVKQVEGIISRWTFTQESLPVGGFLFRSVTTSSRVDELALVFREKKLFFYSACGSSLFMHAQGVPPLIGRLVGGLAASSSYSEACAQPQLISVAFWSLTTYMSTSKITMVFSTFKKPGVSFEENKTELRQETCTFQVLSAFLSKSMGTC